MIQWFYDKCDYSEQSAYSKCRINELDEEVVSYAVTSNDNYERYCGLGQNVDANYQFVTQIIKFRKAGTISPEVINKFPVKYHHTLIECGHGWNMHKSPLYPLFKEMVNKWITIEKKSGATSIFEIKDIRALIVDFV
jgi:hypothetical protein